MLPLTSSAQPLHGDSSPPSWRRRARRATLAVALVLGLGGGAAAARADQPPSAAAQAAETAEPTPGEAEAPGGGGVPVPEVLRQFGVDHWPDAAGWRARMADLQARGEAFTEAQLKELSKRSEGAMAVIRDAGDRLKVEVDRQRLHDRYGAFTQELRDRLDRWFPDTTAAARARYGMTIFRPTDADEAVGTDATDAEDAAAAAEPVVNANAAAQSAGDAPAPAPTLAKAESADPSTTTLPPTTTEPAADTSPLPEDVIILVHGFDEPGALWADLRPYLLAGGCTIAEFTYPNDQAIHDSAVLLRQELAGLRARGVLRVRIVAHSMGGLVSRDLLTAPDLYASDRSGGDTWPAVDRLITVGTPNHGSSYACLHLISELRDQLAHSVRHGYQPFGSFYDGDGQAALDLLPDSDFLAALNARPLPPDLPITVIAGRASGVDGSDVARLRLTLKDSEMVLKPELQTRLREALDSVSNAVGDGVVRLDSTPLEGVDDYLVLDGNHLDLIRNWLRGQSRVPTAFPTILDRLGLDPTLLAPKEPTHD